MNSEKKKIPIYYFSGTGNSLFIARDIASKIDGEPINIASLMNKEEITTDINIIGFSFPIYDFKPAQIMLDFIKKIKKIEDKYIFAFGTYGIAPSKAMEVFSSKLKETGGKLSLGFAIQMPHNGIGSGIFSKKQHDEMFKNWEKRRTSILENISKRNLQKPQSNKNTDLIKIYILQGTLFKMIPTLSKLIFYVLFHGGWKSLAFKTNEKCNSCGICKKICPMENIKFSKSKPIWGDNCSNCFACIHWCPQNAVILGPDLNIAKYHHPKIQLSDMIETEKND